MRAFIIYTPGSDDSKNYADKCLESFAGFKSWNPELFPGLTPGELESFEKTINRKISHVVKSKAQQFLDSGFLDTYQIKKSCSLNHYRLFKKCIGLNEPIAVIEHDSHCVAEWPAPDFSDILLLNVQSAVKLPARKKSVCYNRSEFATGVSELDLDIMYKFQGVKRQAIPGTAAYAVSPAGAAKMIKVYETYGWEQSDFIINSGNVNIGMLVPELFTFKLPNLGQSTSAEDRNRWKALQKEKKEKEKEEKKEKK